jgi:hypothetical protein
VLALHHLEQGSDAVAIVEWRLASRILDDATTNAPNVGAEGVVLAVDDLGGDVPRSANCGVAVRTRSLQARAGAKVDKFDDAIARNDKIVRLIARISTKKQERWGHALTSR